MKNKALIATARESFHKGLIARGVLSVDKDGVPSNADTGNKPSRAIGGLVAERLGARVGEKLPAQSAGKIFEELICEFLGETFPKLQHLRPGKWQVFNLGNNNAIKTSNFAQYEHLAHLAKVLDSDRELATMLGNDYMVAPDIVIARELCSDSEINRSGFFIDESICLKTDIREANGGQPLMHASVSAKPKFHG